MLTKHLPGLNSLRFFAAFFVVISHANISMIKLGIYPQYNVAFLNKGGDAVDFFFTLSGFLITYLLFWEIKETQTVSIRNFYIRRILRIWPLYFLIVLIGFIIMGVIYPWMYHQVYFDFPPWKGLLFFLFFLPNYAAKYYMVGLLNPLWSIGVEEQFYLFWAPFIKITRKYLLPSILLFLIGSTIFYLAVEFDRFENLSYLKNFFLTQKFYAMATGSLFAYILFHFKDIYNKSFLASQYFQAFIWILIIGHYLFGFPFSESIFFKISLSYIYGLLILQISSAEKKLIQLERPVLIYLGSISYGIYMFHMLVDYFLRFMTMKIINYDFSTTILVSLYYILLLFMTILIAAFSQKYFEKYFLNLKYKLKTIK